MTVTPYYVYILRCEDGSLYTGISTDVYRRFREHAGEGKNGAKYTAHRKPIKIERVWQTLGRAQASRLEYRIKTLTHPQKEQLIAAPDMLGELFGDQLDVTVYEAVREIG